jgi:CRISPR/Cas system type I-B associated protein Csh2 (Cas7 group RAMP superfamily)
MLLSSSITVYGMYLCKTLINTERAQQERLTWGPPLEKISVNIWYVYAHTSMDTQNQIAHWQKAVWKENSGKFERPKEVQKTGECRVRRRVAYQDSTQQ